VAASSAFPTFTAVTIPLKEIKRIDPETSPASPDDKEVEGIICPFPSQLPDPLCLSDGGVLDNIGVTSILADALSPEAPHNYYLIASDAGAVVDRLKSPPRGRLRKVHYLRRQFEMRGHHNNQMTSFLALRYHRGEMPDKGLAKLNINEAVPHAGENLDKVKKLTSIPTRLKRLSDPIICDLICHGSNLLWTRVSEYMSELLPSERLMPGTEKKQANARPIQEAIQKRLSIRGYAEASIPAKHMDILFKALQLAASGNNSQNWEFVFVKDPDTKQRLVRACSNQRFVKDCTYFIAAVANPTLKWHMVDITIALTQFALQAVELGYGTCWIGAFEEAGVKQVLNVPDNKKVVICMTLGLPTGKHVPRNRKALKEIIYLNKFGARFKSSDE